jgi:hypothetical protein
LIDEVIDTRGLFEGERRGRQGFFFEGPVEKVVVQSSKIAETIVEESVTQEKVIRIGEGAEISAPVVIADSIQNSFNSLAQSDLNAELKTLLDQLLQAVNQVNKDASPDQAETAEAMARDAETLVKEATSSQPRRQWYQMSVEGLEQAAISVGKIAEPVLEIVTQLLPLLVP